MNVSLAQLRAARAMLAWTSDDLARRARVCTAIPSANWNAARQNRNAEPCVAALEAGGIEFSGGGVQPKAPQRSFSLPHTRVRAAIARLAEVGGKSGRRT